MNSRNSDLDILVDFCKKTKYYIILWYSLLYSGLRIFSVLSSTSLVNTFIMFSLELIKLSISSLFLPSPSTFGLLDSPLTAVWWLPGTYLTMKLNNQIQASQLIIKASNKSCVKWFSYAISMFTSISRIKWILYKRHQHFFSIFNIV